MSNNRDNCWRVSRIDHDAQCAVLSSRQSSCCYAYQQGLNGKQAAWAHKKYHGHRTIPSEAALEALAVHQERANNEFVRAIKIVTNLLVPSC